METVTDGSTDREPETSVVDPADVTSERAATPFLSMRSGATGLRGADLAVLGALFLLPCAYLPVFQISAWTPRMMVLLLVIPAGVIALARLVRSGDTAARWAAAALGMSFVSVLAADSFLASFKGFVGQDSSFVSLLGAFSLWALARFMSDDGKRLVVPTLLAAFGVNLFIATIQVVARVEGGPISLFAGRATGFTPNPVYLGALMVGGAAMCLHRLATSSQRRLAWAAGVVAFSAGVAFSGSRVALLSMIVVAVYCVVRLDRVRAVLGLAVAACGTLIGSLIVRTFATGRDSVSRLSEGPNSGGRSPTWRAAVEAFTERPLVGWGPGRFRYAVQGRLSVEDMAPLKGGNFFDAHNVVLGLAVAVGIPGLILFLGFAWATARRVSPAMGAVAAAIVMTWALQPLSLTTLPVVLALLGVWSAPEKAALIESSVRSRRTVGGAVAVGLVLSLGLGVVDFMFNTAVQSGDAQAMLTLEKLYVRDPVVTNIVAQSLSYQVEDDRSRDEMFDAYERTIEIEPTRSLWWVELARWQGTFGDVDAALESADRALKLEPFDQGAWHIRRVAAEQVGDEQLEREAIDILCKLKVEGACDAEVGTDGIKN